MFHQGIYFIGKNNLISLRPMSNRLDILHCDLTPVSNIASDFWVFNCLVRFFLTYNYTMWIDDKEFLFTKDFLYCGFFFLLLILFLSSLFSHAVSVLFYFFILWLSLHLAFLGTFLFSSIVPFLSPCPSVVSFFFLYSFWFLSCPLSSSLRFSCDSPRCFWWPSFFNKLLIIYWQI